MPDNQRYVRKRLGRLGLGPEREEEIFRELSEHLADHAAALENEGARSVEALAEALSAVPDWPKLRSEIVSAETGEVTMNNRTKALWLPALCALILSNVLLALIQIFGPVPHFYVLRTGTNLEIFCAFVVPWLITQPLVGAVAAYWSRRAGGTRQYQLLAALAPAIALFGVFLLVLPVSMIVDKHVPQNTRLTGFLVLTATWVLLPAVPLLLGAAPFLRKAQPQS